MTKNKSISLLAFVFIGVINVFALKYKIFGDSFNLCLGIHVIVFILVATLLLMIRRNKNKSPLDKISFGVGILFIIVNLLFGLGVFALWNNHRDYNAQGIRIQMKSLGWRLANFKRHCGRFPLTDEGLTSLITKVKENFCKDHPVDEFIEAGKVPLDYCDQEFQYESDGTTYSLKTQHEKRVFIKTDKFDVYEEKVPTPLKSDLEESLN